MKRIKLCPSSSPIHGNYSSSPQLPVGIIANRRPSGPFEIRVPWMMGNQPLINHHNFRQPIVIGNIPRGGSSVLWCCLPPPRQLRAPKKRLFPSERRLAIKRSYAKTMAAGVRLKRLQRKRTWLSHEKRKERRTERALRFVRRKDRQEFYMARRRPHSYRRQVWGWQRGQLQSSHRPPSRCPLWNCQRPRRLRRDRLISVFSPPRRERPVSRASRLSDMSRRSRTPIITLCSSPDRNYFGF
ncbi:uncharacterized protein LOC118433874 [Folsomia candida]|uniref:Uncharacterized protein n=1 Tax=Folsomia candida TaxID=158441 RepID=A0A226EXL3_FOLCA|nr:uncharacterized protein LOC118433874 [Folsomia candida]OXA61918.1 hypothetical protein Fcan01_03860 [Folsomia candida]